MTHVRTCSEMLRFCYKPGVLVRPNMWAVEALAQLCMGIGKGVMHWEGFDSFLQLDFTVDPQ